MKKYQVILDVPAINLSQFPEAFIALLQAVGFQISTFSQMTGTQVVAGRRLVQGEVVPMSGHAGEATEIILAGATANYAGSVSLVGAQTAKAEEQYDTGEVDENNDPIMAYRPKAYKKISAAAIAPYVVAYDNQDPPVELTTAQKEAGLLDGSIKLNRHVGAGDWVII